MTTHLGFPLETVAVFVVLSVGAIAIDLFAHRRDQPMSLKSAALWSVFWIAVSLAFGGYLWFHHGSETASLFFTGYALEKVLSVDNLFVIMAVFSWFKIPEAYRHRVLYWGIIGAIVFRMIFVAVGAGLMAMMGAYVELLFAAVVGVGLLSTVVPYSLEALALTRLPAATFALFTALLPASSAVVGALMLRQVPAPAELAGLVLVSVAVWIASGKPHVAQRED